MKKIPTVFTRVFKGRKIAGIRPTITPGCEEAFLHGDATIKFDGSCCAIIDGVFYKRYDAKKGKQPPENAIPCCDPDPITEHWPHWVPIDPDKSEDKWFIKARMASGFALPDGTYEAIGKHFNGNPYNMDDDFLIKHGTAIVLVYRDFDLIREYLAEHSHEGLVFWLNGEPVCKIKRSDFGLSWPVK